MSDKKDKTALRYLSRTDGRAKVGIVALAGVQVMQGMASVCYALFLHAVINSAVAGDRTGFWLDIARLAALLALQLALSALYRWLDVSTRGSLENRFKERLLCALLRRDYTAVHGGEALGRGEHDYRAGRAIFVPDRAGRGFAACFFPRCFAKR